MYVIHFRGKEYTKIMYMKQNIVSSDLSCESKTKYCKRHLTLYESPFCDPCYFYDVAVDIQAYFKISVDRFLR